MQHVAYIGMGANQAGPAGEPEATLAAAAQSLSRLGVLSARSSLFLTEPVGFAAQPSFLNAVVGLQTALMPLDLLHALMAIEQKFGRDRGHGIVNGPRTLDLDLLLFNDWTLSAPELTVPHPRLSSRAFVLIPMVEIAPHLLVPGTAATVLELAGQLTLADRQSVRRVVRAPWERVK